MKLHLSSVMICSLSLSLGLAAQTAQTTASASPTQLAAAPTGEFQVQNTAVPERLDFVSRGGWTSFWQRFQPAEIGAPDLRNPSVWQRAASQGSVYLSLTEVLRLALTADLDVADAAYTQLLAKPDYYRTLAGGSARGVAGESISSALFSGAIGASSSGGSGINGSSAGSALGGGSGVHGGGGGYDPSINIAFQDEHTRAPLNTSFYGTAVELLNQAEGGISYGQSFTTGTGYSVSFSSFRSYQNSQDLFLNPEVASTASIGITQELLNGGSRTANRAYITLGANSLRYADANFKDSVTTVVAQAATQYWTLAAAGQQVQVALQGEQRAQQTLDNTNDLIQAGKVPASNRITAESSLSAAHLAVIQAQSDQAKAESKLKLFLTKQWTPDVISARVVPSDQLPSPTAANLPVLNQMITRAVSFSPKLAEDRINISNDDLTVKVRQNTLLPTLSVYADYSSSGVAGIGVNCAIPTVPCPAADIIAPINGGLGTSVGDIFSYKAPDYGVGFSLSVPVWNRSNRADEATAELQAAQARVDLQKDQNAISEQVTEDRIELENQVAQLNTARQSVQELEQALNDTQEKYKMGKATIDDVITAQVALIGAQKAEITAQQAFATAQITLSKDSGTLLDEYHISLGKAMTPASVGSLK